MMRAALGRPPRPPPPARPPHPPPARLNPLKRAPRGRAGRVRVPRPRSFTPYARWPLSPSRAPARLVRGGRMGSAAAAGSDLWKLAAIPVCTRHLDM